MIEYSAKNSNLTMTVYNTVDSSHGNDSAGNFTATDAVTYQYWAAFLGLFVLLTLFGNILVVLAVIKVRTLQSVTNYLILSLAIADIFVGALVMPLAVYVEVMGGDFPLHVKVCDAWVSLDVLACTASILMMTAISIDRYLAITSAILYSSTLKHSTWYPVLMISLCWVISLAVALPILLGANNTEHRIDNVCFFFNPLFSTMSSMASFFIPTTVMVILYWRIFRIIRQRASISKAKDEKQFKAMNLKRESSSENSGQSEEPLGNFKHQTFDKQTPKSKTSSPVLQYIDEDALVNQQTDTGYGSTTTQPLTQQNRSAETAESKDSLLQNGSKDHYDSSEQDNGNHVNGNYTNNIKKVKISPKTSNLGSKRNGQDSNMDSPARCNALSRNFNGHNNLSIRKSSHPKRRDKREKRERKATITLVVVLCVFLVCWIPFFLANNLSAICQHWQLSLAICDIPDALMSFIVWLGYINSMLNPMIYAALNVEYRKAFKKLLNCVNPNTR